MRFEEYRHYDAVALAGLVGKGEVSAGELLDLAIARAEAVNPKINAIVHKQYEQARATIGMGLLNGPLAGVPYLIKDLATCRPTPKFWSECLSTATIRDESEARSSADGGMSAIVPTLAQHPFH